jgi:hypothetical protein
MIRSMSVQIRRGLASRRTTATAMDRFNQARLAAGGIITIRCDFRPAPPA